MKPESFIFADVGNSAIVFSIAVIALFLTYYFTIRNIKNSKKSRLPPGPRGIPILGNLAQMVKDPHLKLSQWARQYGKMYTIGMANRKALVINDVKLVRELLGTMASTGKFKTDTIMLISQGPNGILNTDGSVWAEQRSFCMRSLKQLGYGQGRSMEPLILGEVAEVCEWIDRRSKDISSGIVDLTHVLRQSTINALWTLVTGERLSLEDGNSNNLWKYWIESTQYTMKTGLGFFPWLKYIAPKLSGYVDLDKSCKLIHEYVGGKFEEHKRTHVEGQTRDLIDAYIAHLNKINENGDEQSTYFGKVGWKNSVSSVVEIFVGGGETMTSTLKWAAIHLSNNQEIQKKMQDEIDKVIGRDSDPTLLDRTRMPYTEAVILETLRISTVVMMGVPHEVIENIDFHGYNLPKGLILMANLYHIHHDPDIWGDPNDFRPERFLERDGHKLKEYLVPFQAGKRQCIGEALARDVLFLFIVKLFQQFRFSPDPRVSREDYIKADVGIVLIPKCSGFQITAR